jgi:hypothetical protein
MCKKEYTRNDNNVFTFIHRKRLLMKKNTSNLPYSYDFLARQADEAEQVQQVDLIINDEQEIIQQIRMHEIAIAGLLRKLGEKEQLVRQLNILHKESELAENGFGDQ